MKPLIQTASGNIVNFADPTLSTFTLNDIAHGLSNTCRYAGQCKFFYSVAQHAVLVSYLAEGGGGAVAGFAGLHHDDTEAFMCDIPTPLKMLIPEYKAIEERVHNVIFDRLGLQRTLPPEVVEADGLALALEKPTLIGVDVIGWNLRDLTHPSWDEFRAYIKPMTNESAKQLWLDRHAQLLQNCRIKSTLL